MRILVICTWTKLRNFAVLLRIRAVPTVYTYDSVEMPTRCNL